MLTEQHFHVFRLCCLLLASVKAASHACTPAATADQDSSEEIEGINVNLMQQSLMLKAGHADSTGLHGLPSPHIPAIDARMSEEHLRAELRWAKQVLQQWNKHVAALEELLATPRATVNDVHPQSKQAELLNDGVRRSPPRKHSLTSKDLISEDQLPTTVLDLGSVYWVQVLGLWLMFFLAAGYAVRIVLQHEADRAIHIVPWYHDSVVLWKVLVAVAILWYIVGVMASTKCFYYTADRRHLTMVESMYMSVQIMTTIGYGDLTPSFFWGKMFQVVYCMTGVILIGAMVVDGLENYLSSKDGLFKKRLPSYPHLAIWMPAILLIAAGTIFLSAIPGETQIATYGDAFYMSVITLLTIGFGDLHPITPLGQMLSTVWMLLGVACLGCLIGDLSSSIFADRKKFRSKISALTYFNNVKGEDNAINRVEFLCFELVRNGLPKSEFDEAYAMFDEIDTAKNGILDFQEFKAYVDEVCINYGSDDFVRERRSVADFQPSLSKRLTM